MKPRAILKPNAGSNRVAQELKAVQAALKQAKANSRTARRQMKVLSPDLSRGPRVRSEKGAF